MENPLHKPDLFPSVSAQERAAKKRKRRKQKEYYLAILALIVPPWTTFIAIIPPEGAHSEQEFYNSPTSVIGAFWTTVTVC